MLINKKNIKVKWGCEKKKKKNCGYSMSLRYKFEILFLACQVWTIFLSMRRLLQWDTCLKIIVWIWTLLCLLLSMKTTGNIICPFSFAHCFLLYHCHWRRGKTFILGTFHNPHSESLFIVLQLLFTMGCYEIKGNPSLLFLARITKPSLILFWNHSSIFMVNAFWTSVDNLFQ